MACEGGVFVAASFARFVGFGVGGFGIPVFEVLVHGFGLGGVVFGEHGHEGVLLAGGVAVEGLFEGGVALEVLFFEGCGAHCGGCKWMRGDVGWYLFSFQWGRNWSSNLFFLLFMKGAWYFTQETESEVGRWQEQTTYDCKNRFLDRLAPVPRGVVQPKNFPHDGIEPPAARARSILA